MTNTARTALSLAFLAASAMSAAAQSAGDPARGKQAFTDLGCYECHGHVGQGALGFGPALAPRPMPFDAFQAYVHAPKNQMPPYSKAILSDDVMADIYAYVVSIKPPASPSDIKLLNLDKIAPTTTAGPSATTAAPSANASGPSAKGGAIFAQNCSGCHTAPGTAPRLPGRFRGKDAQDLANVVKKPPAGMPALFPDVLNADDVTAVAEYLVRQ